MDIENNQVMGSDDWAKFIGEQFRALRIQADLEQIELATRASVSVGAIKNLEGGKGSSLDSVIKICRALNRTDWLRALAPTITVSPLKMLRGVARAKDARVRVFRPHKSAKAA